MKIFLLFFFSSSLCLAQYAPRGVSINDGYLPNLDQPDKWIVGIDGIIDYQRSSDTNSNVSSSQRGHYGFNLFYGGQKIRGGLQVIHDDISPIKDLSLGLGLSFYRPLFLEFGAAYLQRTQGAQSFDGWSYNLKAGYYFNWIMHIKYRFRIRISLASHYKTINIPTGDLSVLHFYPFLGLEFET